MRSAIDWELLLFLVLFMDVKLAVKAVAIILVYLLRFNFRFGFSFKNSRLPLFYPLILAVACMGFFLNGAFYTPRYLPVFITGLVFWGMCLLASHQVKLSVEKKDMHVIHQTILVFFVINTLISLVNIGLIVHETGALNPYRYQGQYQKYFVQTGDYIKGITFDNSTTNAAISAFGVIYFLFRNKMAMVLVCMAVLLLTGSNFTNLALMLVLAGVFIFRTSNVQKSMIVICLMMLVIFMAKVSPENDEYTFQTFKNMVDPPKLPGVTAIIAAKKGALTADEKKRQFAQNYLDSLKAIINKCMVPLPPKPFIPFVGFGRFIIPGPDINTPPYQTATDTGQEQRLLLSFIEAHKADLPLSAQNRFSYGMPGKGLTFLQTVNFLKHHPDKLTAGDGAGNFASKLAFKASGLGLQGEYPAKYVYISNDFMRNHLDIYLDYFSKKAELHTVANSPASVYDQLLGEYGLLGLLAFVLFYIGYFLRRYRHLSYGLPILVLLLAMFLIDYWFEQLCIVVFFELLVFLNIKEKQFNPSVHVSH